MYNLSCKVLKYLSLLSILLRKLRNNCGFLVEKIICKFRDVSFGRN